MIKFEWDELKNIKSRRKHDVDFIEALSVFYDEDALLISDPSHSEFEERFILLGMSSLANLLIVCHCYKSNDEIVRIISARKATENEAKQYAERKLSYEKRI